jgi:hypothetical protein
MERVFSPRARTALFASLSCMCSVRLCFEALANPNQSRVTHDTHLQPARCCRPGLQTPRDERRGAALVRAATDPLRGEDQGRRDHLRRVLVSAHELPAYVDALMCHM